MCRARVGDDLDALFDNGLFWTEASDAESGTEEAALGTPLLLSAVSHGLPLYKRKYVELLRSHVGEVQSRCSQCNVTKR